MKYLIYITALMMLCVTHAQSETGMTSTIDIDLAQQYFEELKTILDADAGHLWGIPLDGPTMFVDPDSRTVVANRQDKDGKLHKDGKVWIGTLPENVNISNTAITWSGEKWTMVNWQAISPDDPYSRAKLLVHECWHRVQDKIDMPSVMTTNEYLDGSSGRVYMILEFRALAAALKAGDVASRHNALRDALTLRQYRQSLFPGNNENAFEMHEGLAEYTGLKLCGLPDSLLIRIAARKLKMGEDNSGLASSFAYLTGPAYGLLLDGMVPRWRDSVRHGADLQHLIAGAVSWQRIAGAEHLRAKAEECGEKYGANDLIATEANRAKIQLETANAFRARLDVHGRLVIRNDNLNFTFNPQEELTPFDSTGVIYTTMRISGDFGVLEVTDGIIRSNDWQVFVAVAPENTAGNAITWPGYSLTLNPGWGITEKAPGVYLVTKR